MMMTAMRRRTTRWRTTIRTTRIKELNGLFNFSRTVYLILHLHEAVYVVPGVDDLGDLLLGVGRVVEHLGVLLLFDPHHLKQVNIIIFKIIALKFNFL